MVNKKKKSFKKDLKKLGSSLVKGFKETEKFVGKYGPKAHAYFRGVSENTMGVFAPQPVRGLPNNLIPRKRKGYVDLTAKRKPKRVLKGKGGFYLDFTD